MARVSMSAYDRSGKHGNHVRSHDREFPGKGGGGGKAKTVKVKSRLSSAREAELKEEILKLYENERHFRKAAKEEKPGSVLRDKFNERADSLVRSAHTKEAALRELKGYRGF